MTTISKTTLAVVAETSDPPRQTHRMVDQALAYAARGWHVFPVPPGERKSYKSAEYSEGRKWGATTDAKQIERDFEKWPNANVGIVTGPKSGIWVVDADTLEGHDVDGIASLRELEAEYGTLPKTLMAESPSGSLHYYFNYSTNATIKNSESGFADGIDVRGEGGMVIAAPSERPGKGTYRWLNANAVADAPNWLIKLAVGAGEGSRVAPTGAGDQGPTEWCELLTNIRDGRVLHKSTRGLAAKLVVAGLGGGAAVNFLCGVMHLSGAKGTPRWQERYDNIRNLVTSAEKFRDAGQIDLAELRTRLLQSSAQFVAGFVPPDYLIDGLLQRRFVYSMTAPTGTGKTCIALRMAAHVALGMELAGRQVEKGRVLYFAGENPVDVCTRWIKQCEELEQSPDEMDVFFLSGAPPISDKAIRAKIDAEAAEHGPFSLVIIDTSAAYFRGDDENSNAQLAAHARMMRSFVELPGGPTVIVTCHPTKNPDMTNLLPRGGGAFLNEVDGNLVCLKEPGSPVVTLDTHGKFRGPEFEPFSFKLVAGTSEKLKDTKGRLVSTVTAEPITQEDRSALEDTGHDRQNQLLRVMKANAGLSLSELAEALGWSYKNGGPNTSMVHRMMLKLAKDRLVAKKRDHYELTKKGKEALEDIETAPPHPAQPFLATPAAQHTA
jgi:predicted transcriptional regulator